MRRRTLHPSEYLKADTVSRASCRCQTEMSCPACSPKTYAKAGARHRADVEAA